MFVYIYVSLYCCDRKISILPEKNASSEIDIRILIDLLVVIDYYLIRVWLCLVLELFSFPTWQM